jgi:hypothetical protein
MKKIGKLILFLLIIAVVYFAYLYFKDKAKTNQPNNVKSTVSVSKKTEVSKDSFPMNDISAQSAWYDSHNVAMVNRCYPSGVCSAEDWAFAVYNNKNDPRGATLKQEADIAEAKYLAQFPKGKCITDSGVQICDLSNSVKTLNKDGTRVVSFQANEIDCLDVKTGKQVESESNSIKVDSGNTYCVSDFGDVYIDSTIQIAKYFNKIMRKSYNSPYYINTAYEKCIWTYADGSGSIPAIEISNSTGPDSGFDVKAFCKNGNNQVDIYTYQTN